MDMSVKLNQSYPAVRPTEQVAERTTAKQSEPSRDAADKGVPDTEKVKSAVKEIEKFLASNRRNLEFSTDEESGKIVVKVIASETGELVRQIPSEEVLKIANSLSDVNSLLFNAKA
ncbi:flagellar protein FlaG [Pseudomonas defluvii]|uniref:flagellar protein FlaG n=1 Tax=Pseudomonas defluvii TaxID=1876757 RepID=UPI00390655E1